MQVKQDSGFRPITIVIETEEEASEFLNMLSECNIGGIDNDLWDLFPEEIKNTYINRK